MQSISKSFGDLCANRDVNLSVAKGEIHALLGENGAGKTTLMNTLYGIYPPDSGTIALHDRPVRIRSPREAIAHRIGMVHQHFMLVPTLTVSQNITLGVHDKGYPFTDRSHVNAKISQLSKAYGLDIDPKDLVEDLSVGVRQRVEIIKLLYHEAELLILDEPTAVLTPQETDSFFAVLRRLKQRGHAVIIITHRIAEVMAIADRVTVLRDGEKVADLEIGDIDENRLSELMIGRRLAPVSRAASRQGGSACLKCQGLALAGDTKPVLDDISFSIGSGEILGVAGVDGNGQQALAEVLVGIRRPTGGRMELKGRSIRKLSVKQRKRLGIAYIPDDRHHDGLILDMGVSDNLMLARYDRAPFSLFRWLNAAACRLYARRKRDEYQVKTAGVDTAVRTLSGGNQQKIILARELEGDPALIVACQPTRGLDIGAQEFVHELLLEKRAAGAAILLISADLDQILALSGRVAVLFEGRINGLFVNDGALDPAAIGLKMAGLREEAA